MGSFGDDNHSKADNPGLSWVQAGIDQFNERRRIIAARAPLRLKLLDAVGIRQPWIRWQRDHWYDDV